MKKMIIDAHTHIFSPEVIKNRKRFCDDKHFSMLYDNEKSKLVDHTMLLQAMDSAGVDGAIALGYPWQHDKYLALQNSYFQMVAEEARGRIYPFATIPMHTAENIESEVARVKDMGLFGIGEVGFYSTGLKQSEAEVLSRLFESALKHSLPVCLHVNEPVGHKYVGKYITEFGILFDLLKEFQDLVVILAHWGGGLLFYELMPEVSKSLKNVYYDTAASPYLYNNDIYNIASQIVGPEKILLGSDYPLIGFKRYIDSIEGSLKNKKERDSILGRNVRKILFLE